MEKNKIRVAIVGYGNLGKGVENELKKNPDMDLVCIFTRREPSTLKVQSNVPIVNIDNMADWEDKVDVAFLCGGSATDLSIQGPMFASLFNTVDSFDTHAKAGEYARNKMEPSVIRGKNSVTSIGWDPGLFSQMRLLIKSILPKSQIYTFWGKGVSQGHSNAIRKIEGVKDAKQYTVPRKDALEKVRKGEIPTFTKIEMHKRECYVVAEEGTNKEKIEEQIKYMPNYFNEYNTKVNFISEEKLLEKHSRLNHGGTVIGVGETTEGTKQVVEFSLKLDSNPEFTASVLIAYGRAAYRMWNEGERGYKTFADIAPKYLSSMDYDEIIKQIL